MKRSEINYLIGNSIDFFNKMNFRLPPWAYWTPDDRKGKYNSVSEIIEDEKPVHLLASDYKKYL